MAFCPDIQDPRFRRLVELLGEQEANRHFLRYEYTADPSRALDEALKPFDISRNPISGKVDQIEALGAKVGYDSAAHRYWDAADPRREFTSVSRVLDDPEVSPHTIYHGEQAGALYADKGTAIHQLARMIVDNYSDANINKHIADNNIPESIHNQLKTFISKLRSTGVVASEARLADFDRGIAGTADVIHFRNDGAIDVYDFKTANLTPWMKDRGRTNPWDPQDFEGYKARRYTTQMEFYARMIENGLGQPVSGRYVVPIEVENEGDVPEGKIIKATLLDPEDTANVQRYGYHDEARNIVDRVFLDDQKSRQSVSRLASPDDTNNFMTAIRGYVEGLATDPVAQAEHVWANNISRDGKRYYNSLLKKYISFRSTDKNLQLQQIVDEQVTLTNTLRRDMPASIRNFLDTDNDAYLTGMGLENSASIKTVLSKYKGIPGLEIYELKDIEGFENKPNWIVISQPLNSEGVNKTDLLYFTNAHLHAEIGFSKSGGFMQPVSQVLFGKTLFRNFFTELEARHILHSSLRNTVADSYKLEAALIAMKLKEAEPKMGIDEILLTEANDEGFGKPVSVDLWNVLPDVKNLVRHPKMKDIVPQNMVKLFADDKYFDPKTYGVDLMMAYKRYADYLGTEKEQAAAARMESIANDKSKYDELVTIVEREVNNMAKEGVADSDIAGKHKRYLLSRLLMTLKEIPVSMTPANFYEEWVSMPQNIKNETIQHLFLETKKGLGKVIDDFLPLQKSFTDATKKLFKDSGAGLDFIENRTVSQTSKYYLPLLQKMRLQTDQGEKEVSILMLIQEGSKEFASLTQTQQEEIVRFNDHMEMAAEAAGMKWERGRLPVVNSSFYNQFFKLTHGQMAEAGTKDLVRSVAKSMFQSLDERDFITQARNTRRSVANLFYSQSSRGQWERRTGIDFANRIITDSKAYDAIETNLEVLHDMFLLNAFRAKHLQKPMTLFNAAEMIWRWQKDNLFEDRVGYNLDWLKKYRDGVINNRSADAGSLLDMAVRTMNRFTGTVLIPGNPAVVVGNVLGQETLSLSNAMAATFSKNKINIGLGEWTKALGYVLSPANIEKVNGMLDAYHYFNMDMSSFMNGYHRYGNRSWFRMKKLYGGMTAGDWLSRSQMLIARMMKDNVLDLHDANGHYVGEDKDPRFQGEKGRVFYKLYKEQMEKDGFVKDGKITRAYDFMEGEKWKDDADMTVGGFDRETRGTYNFKAVGKLAGLFKTWLPARLEKGFARPYTKIVAGQYEIGKDPEGTPVLLWKGNPMEGIFHSMLAKGADFYQMLKDAERIPFNEQQKLNLNHSLVDMAFITMVAAGASSIPNEKGETWDDYSRNIVLRSLQDLLAVYNVAQLAELVYTPIAVDFLVRSWRTWMNIMAGIPDPEDPTFQRMLEEAPVTRYFERLNKEFESFENSNQE